MKILVLGMPASGKSTCARALAAKHGLQHIEADQYFRKANGQTVTPKTLLKKVKDALPDDHFVVEGHFKTLKPLLMDRVDQVVWLDVPDRKIWPRFILRALKRGPAAWPKEWNSLKFSFLNRDRLRKIQEASIAEFRARGTPVEIR